MRSTYTSAYIKYKLLLEIDRHESFLDSEKLHFNIHKNNNCFIRIDTVFANSGWVLLRKHKKNGV